ncbi:MAG: type IX secretion system membrane protein PorP/SprF [Lentimicrobiaceae bacterium]|jgi:type IX secretion system PorP/SprF family membrane protein|nr:type IX secretion system membrane protein PorP/SprF [Lentimicrobiaceae bacterium]MCP4910895.1 type IX secretion system membrane protein PorP/SprF [Bacteroidota bacterium]MBT3453735.1 type IX secretion system membrane protein PorP/SprF [Lentimicrobiaceae bacterium]MBT3819540.1 type IX secretion system membrane protein PorP/SprF [Lentimicrobiaceae bacterium]MBT4061681.1 type IX secretion system membrane protein PorP/SprF [Lentimicrobiaceae bacterium]
MRTVNYVIILFLAVITCTVAKAQDPEFSQFYANPLYLNPAYAGSVDCGRLGLNYRNQYPSLANAYVTYNVSYDQSLPSISSGFGLLVMNDAQGDGGLVRTSAALFYSYNLTVSSSINVRFGVKGAYYQEKLNWNKFIFASQIDPTTGNIDPNSGEPPPTKDNITTVDFAVGAVMSYSDLFFVGIAVDHLTQPSLSFYDNSDSKLPMKVTVNAGAMINASSRGDLLISPNVLYMQQENFHQLNAGLYINKYPFVVGGWFRHNFQNPDAVVALVGLTYNNLRVGYSYDFTVSQVGSKAGGAHEISFAWDFCIYKEKSRKHIRAIKSPSF